MEITEMHLAPFKRVLARHIMASSDCGCLADWECWRIKDAAKKLAEWWALECMNAERELQFSDELMAVYEAERLRAKKEYFDLLN